MELYDYEAGLDGETADVYYCIQDKTTKSDVTMLFIDPNGNNVASTSEGYGVFRNVKVNIAKCDLTIATNDAEGSEFELQNDEKYLTASVSSVTSENADIRIEKVATLDYMEAHFISMNDFTSESGIGDTLYISEYAKINTAGKISASVEYVIFTNDRYGEMIDVTDLYQIITEFGELVVG